MHHNISNNRSLVFARSSFNQLPWPADRTCYFASGRESITALIRAMKLPKSSYVLIPNYVPEGIIAPFQAAGLNVLQYPLDQFLDPKWDHLEMLLVTRRPQLAVMIHYFGLAKPIRQFTDLCHRYDTLVVEDMAHIMQGSDGVLGKTGDFVLYSLPKMIGIPDGSPLVINTSKFNTEDFSYSFDVRHKLYILAQMSALLFSTLDRIVPRNRILPLLRRINGKILDPYGILMAYFKNPNHMSLISYFLLKWLPWNEIVCYRKQLEDLYETKLDKKIFNRFPKLGKSHHCSMGFPVLVDNRNSLVSFLAKKDIHGVFFEHKWNFFPHSEIHAESIQTMKSHFLFPTAFGLASHEIEYVIELANMWASNTI